MSQEHWVDNSASESFVQESPEKFPKNILTHYRETLETIAMMEGETWKNDQTREGKTMYSAVKFLRELRPDPSRNPALDVFTIKGADGWHRYFVYPDGSVTFSSLHVFANSEDKEKAKELGFRTVK